ncbi:hypothetical protein E4M02_00985 [Brevundimonas sp. S30B]|uniref:hypothetical protein n=1 Tax=unclassified Brevundimonas TaxID=2622653 RepID=UPI001072AE59|nr:MULTISPECIES: hypothetical protein [unclassified Brevundimonas]QBX37508.1 hypothetical protein E4M01_06835 [Brevundimonas sp. MF30-B]TFW03699.1 hypothetical protein E4M02_00985 [Brevundimonas sp. S30B]
MFQTQRFAQIGQSPRRRGGGFFAPVLWLFGFVATAIAMAVGAVLAVLTAAAVALIAVVAGALVFFTGLALRARRKAAPVSAMDGDVIEARKVDGAWVAYGWEREGR